MSEPQLSQIQSEYFQQRGSLSGEQLTQALEALNKGPQGYDLCDVLLQWQWIQPVHADQAREFAQSQSVERAQNWVGPYEIIHELSRGGMGIVSRARHRLTGHEVALKLILDKDVAMESSLRFQREAQALAQLKHPNIAQVKDFGRDSGRPYFAMELIEGQSLEDWVQESFRGQGQAPELATLVSIIAQIGRALETCHAQGLVHRDLKPANIMIEAKTGRPVLIDFGLVRLDKQASEGLEDMAMTLTKSGEFLGTPSYMSPEQIDSSKQVTPATDTWALAATLFFSLAGRPPFEKGSLLALLKDILNSPTPKLRSLNPEVPRWLEELIEAGLDKDPADRLPLSEFCQALERQEWQTASATSKLPMLAGVSVALLLMCAMVFLVWGSKTETTKPPKPAPVKPDKPVKPPKPAPEKLVERLTKSDMEAAIHDRERWRALSKEQRRDTAERLAQKLGAGFELQGLKLFECAGLRNELAVFLHRRSGVVLHLIPGGKYVMGTPDTDSEFRAFIGPNSSEDEKRTLRKILSREVPAHKVTVRGFLLGRAELSQKQWFQIYRSRTGHQFIKSRNDLPAASIDYHEAIDWLKTADADWRLPSEAEWEYACRAGSETRYFWGDSAKPVLAWYKGNSQRRLYSEAESQKHANAFGLINMLGNAYEWCADHFRSDYRRGPVNEKPWTNAGTKLGVVRGGGCNAQLLTTRCAVRRVFRRKKQSRVSVTQRRRNLANVGFRVAMSVPELR